ncbi:unnamed protein product [Cercospora beticola]|nr:unnamed protein product [Cercospora beticola]
MLEGTLAICSPTRVFQNVLAHFRSATVSICKSYLVLTELWRQRGLKRLGHSWRRVTILVVRQSLLSLCYFLMQRSIRPRVSYKMALATYWSHRSIDNKSIGS